MKALSQVLNFGKSVMDNGWGMFVNFLDYKSKEVGKKLVKVGKYLQVRKFVVIVDIKIKK